MDVKKKKKRPTNSEIVKRRWRLRDTEIRF
jgi:hypothetical protein